MSRLSKTVIAAMVIMVIALAFGGGFLFAQAYGPTNPPGLDVIDEAWNIILSKYIDQTRIDAANMSRAAIEGIINTLHDPYTTYLTNEELIQITSSLQGEYVGIGTFVTVKDGYIIIVAPIADSPAEKAGIKPGDIILEIDGEPATGLDLQLAASKIKGPEGTVVRLLIQRAGEPEPLLIPVTRAVVEIPSVVYEMRQDIAYIALYQFTEHTDGELGEIIQKLKEDNAKGIVLDLRGNGGGLLDTAVAVASYFLVSGVVVTTKNNVGDETIYEVNEESASTDLPMVVLVNEGTASASEVVIGALQDYGRATIAGNITYGKGSATILFPLSDGSGINVTIAYWYTPLGRLIEGHGIEPDIKLESSGDDAVQWAIDYLR